MRLRVDLKTLLAEQIPDFKGEGITDNGQHVQLKGYALVEVHFDGGIQFALFHPDTDPCTGHVDLYYRPGDHYDGKSPLRRYALAEPVRLDHIENTLWPTGIESLILVINAVEKYLAVTLSNYSPTVWGWIAWQMMPDHQHWTEKEKQFRAERASEQAVAV